MDGWYDVSSNALLSWRCLSNDVGATKKEWERSLLNFVRRTDPAYATIMRVSFEVLSYLSSYIPILIDGS
jgi:hypothetical protein